MLVEKLRVHSRSSVSKRVIIGLPPDVISLGDPVVALVVVALPLLPWIIERNLTNSGLSFLLPSQDRALALWIGVRNLSPLALCTRVQ